MFVLRTTNLRFVSIVIYTNALTTRALIFILGPIPGQRFQQLLILLFRTHRDPKTTLAKLYLTPVPHYDAFLQQIMIDGSGIGDLYQ